MMSRLTRVRPAYSVTLGSSTNLTVRQVFSAAIFATVSVPHFGSVKFVPTIASLVPSFGVT